mgnify:FL=1
MMLGDAGAGMSADFLQSQYDHARHQRASANGDVTKDVNAFTRACNAALAKLVDAAREFKDMTIADAKQDLETARASCGSIQDAIRRRRVDLGKTRRSRAVLTRQFQQLSAALTRHRSSEAARKVALRQCIADLEKVLKEQRDAWEAGLDRRVQHVRSAARAAEAEKGQAAIAAYKQSVEAQVTAMKEQADAE